MSEDYLSFEKVLRELQIDQDELKRLVSAGEIKAYREADQMRFKPEDIEKLKQDKSSDPDVIELLDAEEDLGGEGEPTMELEGAEVAEELSFDDVDFGDETEMDDAGDDSEVLTEDVGELELGEEVEIGSMELEDEDLAEAATAPDVRGRTRIRKSKIAGIAAEEEEEAEPQWALGVLIVSTLFLLIGVLVMMDIATSSPSPLVKWLVGMFQ
ncbi:MAG: helix-turn-helix domain-containing protein [Planctomycetota bacterium]